MSGRLPFSERRTTVKHRLLTAAVAVAAYPSSRRLRTAGLGHHIGIPAPLLRDLVAELEAEYPGIVAMARAADNSIRGNDLRASGIR